MLKNIEVTQDLLDYIYNHTHPLHPVQKDILTHNKTLGDIQRMQISEIQGHFLQQIIKVNNVKSCLEIGTFTGFSTLTMALALPNGGKIITLDHDKKIVNVAKNFFKKGKLEYRADKAGVVHISFGKADFSSDSLFENLTTFYNSVESNKPSGVKGKYIKKLTICSTMGPGINVDFNTF